MEQTTNNTIKIVRLQSGEDIMADMIEDEENDTVLLDNPMHIIFKRFTIEIPNSFFRKVNFFIFKKLNAIKFIAIYIIN